MCVCFCLVYVMGGLGRMERERGVFVAKKCFSLSVLSFDAPIFALL